MIESRPTSRGPSWYDAFLLVAPGHHLVSDGVVGTTLYEDYPSDARRSHLNQRTSMATARQRAVALVLEAHRQLYPGAPPLTPNAVKAILAVFVHSCA